MAADVSITMEAQNKGVIQAMDQVGKKADQLNRKTQAMGGRGQRQGGYTQGMGVLEVSRAIEDAQYGIRGVLNNIPGIIQSFGGSMGLAGVVSIAAVAVSVLGKRLYDFATNAEAAKQRTETLTAANQKYAQGLSAAKSKLEQYNAEQAKHASELKAAAANAEMLRKIGDPMGDFQTRQGNTEFERSGRDTIYGLRKELADLSGKPLGYEMPSKSSDLEGDAEEAKRLVERLASTKLEVERQLGRLVSKGAGDMGAKIHDAETKLAEMTRLAEIQRKEVELNSGNDRKLYRDAAKTLAEGYEREAEKARNLISELENKDKLLKEEQKILMDRDSTAERELDTAEAISKQAELRLGYAKQEEELRRKISEYGEMHDQPSVQDFLDYQNKLNENISSNLSGFRMNPSDMLSSSGRIGGSVKEYSSAVATVNYQRETLKALKDIARNTRTGKVSTYN